MDAEEKIIRLVTSCPDQVGIVAAVSQFITEHQGWLVESNYFTDSEHLKELEDKDLIPFKYCDDIGNISSENNPNGSINNIAGIFNEKKNILGMMPHPERMTDKIISNEDGVNLFLSLLN